MAEKPDINVRFSAIVLLRGKGLLILDRTFMFGFAITSSNLPVSGHGPILSFYNHHDIRGGGKRVGGDTETSGKS
jgi:hypothetical protein